MKKDPKSEIKRLEIYIERVKNQLTQTKTPAHLDFFNREIKRTKSTIENLK